MRLRRPSALIASVVAVAFLAGCAGIANGSSTEVVDPTAQQVPLSELDVLEDPKAYVGGSTAVLGSASITPVVDDPAQELPATVTSHDLGGPIEVTVEDTSRVLGLDMSGSIAATIAGLGFVDTLIGRDISTTFPEVAELPVVTSGGHSINAESVIALRPTLVITDGSIGPVDVIMQLRDAGITVVFIEDNPGFDGAISMAHQVADAYGASDTGELLAASLQDDIDAKIAEIAEIAPEGDDRLRMLFLYIRGGSGIYYLFGSESGANDLIDGIGGIDVASQIGWTGLQPMTDEAVVLARPDIILVMTAGLESAGGIDALLEQKPALAQTPAGLNKRFVDMSSGQVLGFGPRTPDVLDALARAVYAPEG